MHRRLPRQALPILLLLLVTGAAACEPGVSSPSWPASAQTEVGASLPPAASATAMERARLPAGFPVLAGARPEALDDDPAAIARWTSDEVGPVAYDYYVGALPAAGYPTTGLFPGGAVAIIRFDATEGATWQLVLTRDGDGTRIDVRLDRP
jgi:hypothetical protein